MRPSLIFTPFILFALLFIVFLPRIFRNRAASGEFLPATSLNPPSTTAPNTSVSIAVRPVFPGLGEFATRVTNGHPDQVVGVYVENLFALPVIQQPEDEPAYVSDKDGLVTQFGLPTQYGTVGLLAHNYLSGSQFSQLDVNDEIILLHGDGHSDIYRVINIQSFQALNPNSPYSKFIDQTNPDGKILSSAALFNQVYTTPGQLVFQTCIDANGDASWGRLFITAYKVSSIQLILPGELVLNNN